MALQIPASGFVAAIEPIMRACGGTWIAHGSGSADRELVDTDDRIRVPPDLPAYSLRRVWLSDDEQDGYYYGFANEGLWPLCHLAFVRPDFREVRTGTIIAPSTNALPRPCSARPPVPILSLWFRTITLRFFRE